MHPANFGEQGCLGKKLLGQSESIQVYTHYGIGVSLHYVQGLCRPSTVDVIQYLERE